MRILWLALVVVVAAPLRAEAENQLTNFLIGPVFGIRLGGRDGSRAVIGVEGGVGLGPERINLGFESRDDKLFGYLELDPWLYVGASFGFGIDSDGNSQPVLGLWEGGPLKLPDCVHSQEYSGAVTLAAGYRFTGVHELYVTIKAGQAQPFCF